jgi:hypothetical protein
VQAAPHGQRPLAMSLLAAPLSSPPRSGTQRAPGPAEGLVLARFREWVRASDTDDPRARTDASVAVPNTGGRVGGGEAGSEARTQLGRGRRMKSGRHVDGEARLAGCTAKQMRARMGPPMPRRQQRRERRCARQPPRRLHWRRVSIHVSSCSAHGVRRCGVRQTSPCALAAHAPARAAAALTRAGRARAQRP